MNFKNLAMWAIIVFLTIGLYNMFKNPQTNVRGGDKIILKVFIQTEIVLLLIRQMIQI